MVDTVDSKSTAAMRVGSNPTGGTYKQDWCNGSTRVSKTFSRGSSPLSCACPYNKYSKYLKNKEPNGINI